MKFNARALLLLLLASAFGCGQKQSDRLPVVAVKGKVLFNGKPAAGASVSFQTEQTLLDPGGTKVRPTGVVETDGTYRPSTYLQHDGLPIGEYNVTVVWPTVTVDHGEEINGPDRLQGRYSNPQQPAAKVSIQAGTKELPIIDLK